MTDAIELPSVLDLVAAPGLLENFLQKRGHDLILDAGQVQRVGGQCLQVLLAAHAAWAADGHNLLLQNPSEPFIDMLALMGLSPDELTHHVSAKNGETEQ